MANRYFADVRTGETHLAMALGLDSLIVTTKLPIENRIKVLGSERLTGAASTGSRTVATS